MEEENDILGKFETVNFIINFALQGDGVEGYRFKSQSRIKNLSFRC